MDYYLIRSNTDKEVYIAARLGNNIDIIIGEISSRELGLSVTEKGVTCSGNHSIEEISAEEMNIFRNRKTREQNLSR